MARAYVQFATARAVVPLAGDICVTADAHIPVDGAQRKAIMDQ